jgi:hypothetical protein
MSLSSKNKNKEECLKRINWIQIDYNAWIYEMKRLEVQISSISIKLL